jgi:glycosyltransferase involved in cell wall biosynthesis
MCPAQPLVTFALFAFNQEKFVLQAIEGALAQTYSPLEVILSDDCSTDRTFEIMKEATANYSGPHRVIVRRNPINLLTALHVQAVANEMSGDLMVVAAGDDISLPQRVERLVEAWDANGRYPVVLHSQADLISEEGMKLGSLAFPRAQRGVEVNLNWYLKEKLNPLLSPTAAYVSSLFSDFPPIIGGSLIEDGPLVIRGFLMGKFLCVDEPLVLLRKVNQSSGTGYACDDLDRWNRFVRSKIISGFNKLQDIRFGNAANPQAKVLARRTRRDIRGLSRCVFPEYLSQNVFGRVWMSLILMLNYPSTYRLRGRIGFALNFAHLLPERRRGSS